MRLFIALDLPGQVKAALREDAAWLRKYCDGHFTPEENYHLTLAFLGEQPEVRVDDAVAAMDACAVTPFSVTLGGLGQFENGVLWRGIEESGDLLRLQQALTAQLCHRDFHLEQRPFRPHLTLARRAVPHGNACLSTLSAQLKPLSFQAGSMTLLRSKRSNIGAAYSPVYKKRIG